MIEKKAIFEKENPDRAVRRLQDELDFVGRQMANNLNPETSLYKKLGKKKEQLRKELYKYPRTIRRNSI